MANMGTKSCTQYSVPWIYALFFLSGIPALVYQIVWQRSLFIFYGVNIQSITMIVADFMLGLGIGALAGAYLSKRKNINLLVLYAVLEVLAGLIGFISLAVLHWVGLNTLNWSQLSLSILIFCLLLVPTIIMGASLPILTEYLVKRLPHVGRSVALLYSANTLGAAFACFILASFVMHVLGQHGSINLAAILNCTIGIGCFLLWRQKTETQARELTTSVTKTVSLRLLCFITALIGFISLSYEIIWIHAISFASGSTAPAITKSLGYYLVGIGYGAIICNIYFKRCTPKATTLFSITLIGAVIAALVLPGMMWAVVLHQYRIAQALIMIGTISFGMLLPFISYYATNDIQEAGSTLGIIYFANIIGGTAGCLITGFILLNIFSTIQLAVLIFSIALLTSLCCLLVKKNKWLRPTLILVFCFLGITLCLNTTLKNFYGKLLFTNQYKELGPLKYLVENNVGTIAVDKNNVVYGNGAYDGNINVDLTNDKALLYRMTLLPFLSSNLDNVLMVGLSSGAWATVLAANPMVKHLTIIEINPGYISLIKKYYPQNTLLHNPKVTIIMDDGRRWLLRHKQRKFNAIVMNTTYHWRMLVSMLLSKEMLQLVQAHLTPTGIMYYNSTWSSRAVATALSEFKYVTTIYNFIAASNAPFEYNSQRMLSILKASKISGQPLTNWKSAAGQKTLRRLQTIANSVHQDNPIFTPERFTAQEKLEQATQGLQPITNNNMGSEWLALFKGV
jgi:spermidine synthase